MVLFIFPHSMMSQFYGCKKCFQVSKMVLIKVLKVPRITHFPEDQLFLVFVIYVLIFFICQMIDDCLQYSGSWYMLSLLLCK